MSASKNFLRVGEWQRCVVTSVSHPDIVQVFDFNTIDGYLHIVMEYWKGLTAGDLSQKIPEGHHFIVVTH